MTYSCTYKRYEICSAYSIICSKLVVTSNIIMNIHKYPPLITPKLHLHPHHPIPLNVTTGIVSKKGSTKWIIFLLFWITDFWSAPSPLKQCRIFGNSPFLDHMVFECTIYSLISKYWNNQNELSFIKTSNWYYWFSMR